MLSQSSTYNPMSRMTTDSEVSTIIDNAYMVNAVENQSRTCKNQYKELNETVRVTVSSLNVRQQPTTTSGVVRVVKKGDVLNIIAHVYGFGLLEDRTGYVYLDCTEVVSDGTAGGEGENSGSDNNGEQPGGDNEGSSDPDSPSSGGTGDGGNNEGQGGEGESDSEQTPENPGEGSDSGSGGNTEGSGGSSGAEGGDNDNASSPDNPEQGGTSGGATEGGSEDTGSDNTNPPEGGSDIECDCDCECCEGCEKCNPVQ